MPGSQWLLRLGLDRLGPEEHDNIADSSDQMAAALFGELFRTRVRYSGASLGYQLGSACGGGLAPLVAMEILHRTHGTFGVALYMAGACCVTLLCVSLLGEGRTGDLADDGT